MKDKKCTKRYPHLMIQETQTGDDSYPLYRRRAPGCGEYTTTIKMKVDNQHKDIQIDNRWVVPYTPLLSKMFKAHINVEYCNSDRDIFLTLNIVHTYSLCSILKNTDQCIVSCYVTNYTEHQRF
jgi:hypothetical protein